MKRNQRVISMFFVVIFSIFSNTAAFSEPANLSLLVQEIKAYHDSGAYQKELTEAIMPARNYIADRAKANAQSSHPEKLAVVLDIDETSLSNYNRLLSHRFMPSKKQMQKDIAAADAPPIEDMLSLYDDALKQGVTVFFVTGRTESDRLATDTNLKQAGYHDWAGLYFKPQDYNQSSVVPFKSSARSTIRNLGYTIVASIGDQESDLKGGYAEKVFKLPNPYYYIP